MQRYERASFGAPWRAIGGPVSALIGYRGVAWAHAFRNLARKGEPIKIDGDKRAPAGFFRIGRSFGFSPSHLPHYLRIAAGMVCVADPRSPAYNTISSRAKVGWRVRGENMWRVPDYRRGLLVDYPTDRMDRAGSCIFIHVRQPGRTGTSGCVALAERQVAALAAFRAKRRGAGGPAAAGARDGSRDVCRRPCPGRGAARSGALQTRDRFEFGVLSAPDQRRITSLALVLRRIRGKNLN